MSIIANWLGLSIKNAEEMQIVKSAAYNGVYSVLPTLPAWWIWAVVTSVAMVSAGLSPFWVLIINMLVFASSAQLTVLSLLLVRAPMLVIWLSAFAVNLRFIIYSANIRPYFRHLGLPQRLLYGFLNTDLSTLMFEQRFPQNHGKAANLEEQSYFLSMGIFYYVNWQLGCIFGLLFASLIPAEWGLGLAGALTLLVLVFKAVKHWAAVIGVLVAMGTSVMFQTWPYKLWILAAIISGTIAALIVEKIWPKANFGKGI